MPKFILSYDLKNAQDSDHANFKAELEAKGWTSCITVDTGKKKLPETTLLGIFALQTDATTSVLDAESAAKVKISTFIVTERSGSASGRFPNDCDV
jgi:hypothetical protein